jgi:hypothetical protein
MDEVLSSTLRDAVYGRLDYLDTIVHGPDEASRASFADTEITRMTGRGAHCWPSTVWRTAHRHLIGDPAERGSSEPTGRHGSAHPVRRPPGEDLNPPTARASAAPEQHLEE